jgi:hypothetical protein
MDPVLLADYGLVCALLSGLSPAMPGLVLRLAVGALVGVGAVAGLPALRATLGI